MAVSGGGSSHVTSGTLRMAASNSNVEGQS